MTITKRRKKNTMRKKKLAKAPFQLRKQDKKLERAKVNKLKAQKKVSYVQSHLDSPITRFQQQLKSAIPAAHIHMERTQKSNGKFHYKATVQLKHENTVSLQKKAGLLHHVEHRAHTLITGDKPSLQKSLRTWQPKSKALYPVKWAANASYFVARQTGKTMWKSALAAETIAITGSKTVLRQGVQKLKGKYIQEAQDDAHKTVIAAGSLFLTGSRGLIRHMAQKRSFRLEKANDKLAKAESKIKKVEAKQKLTPLKAKHRAQKRAWKMSKKSYQNLWQIRSFHLTDKSRQTPIRKAAVLSRKQIYKSNHRLYKTQKKAILLEKKTARKKKRIQRNIKRQTKPTLLILKPGIYDLKSAGRKAWTKAANADANNDMMQVVDALKRGAEKAKSVRKTKLQRNQKKKANWKKRAIRNSKSSSGRNTS